MKTKKLKSDRGFTIVELMIALAVLSTILIMSTVILIQIGTLYRKGINAAELQNTARNTLGELSDTIQYSGSKPHAPSAVCTPATCCSLLTCYANVSPQIIVGSGLPRDIYSYCVDTTRYSYVLNREMGTDQDPAMVADPDTPHVMWRDKMTSNASCNPLDITTPGIPADAATVTDSGADIIPDHVRLTRFKVEEVPPAGSRTYMIDVWLAYGDSDLVKTDANGRSSCDGKGSQFCGASELTKSVTRRLEN